MRSSSILVPFVAAACVHLAAGQNPLYTIAGSTPGEGFGWSVRALPDFDGDGIDEFAVAHARGIRIQRGSDGSLLRNVQRAQGMLGDVNGDGVLDFWAAVPSTYAWLATDVLSGVDGSVIVTWPWLQTMTGPPAPYGEPIELDDVDGDGSDDFLRVDFVTFATPFPYASSSVVSGATGQALRSHPGYWSLLALNDVDGDGVRDYYLSDEDAAFPDLDTQVVSGATGATLAQYAASSAWRAAPQAIGDVDGDGANDVAYTAVAAPGDVETRVYSSLSGALLLTLPERPVLGYVTPSSDTQAPHGDFDGDGSDDLVLFDDIVREVVVRSTASGAVIQRYGVWTTACAVLADLNADGRDELLAGIGQARSARGKALVLTGAYSERVGTAYGFGDGSGAPCPCGANGDAGEGCANSQQVAAHLGAWGTTSLVAADLMLVADGLWFDSNLVADAFLFQGVAPAPLGATIGGGVLAVSGPLRRLGRRWSVMLAPMPFAYGWDATSLVTAQGWTPGQTVHLQVWYRDGGPFSVCGANTSNALALTFTP